MASKHKQNKIRDRVSQSISLAGDVDKKVDDLITLVTDKEGGADTFILAFCYEIEALKEFQCDKKNTTKDIILKYCGIVKGRNFLKFGDRLLEILSETESSIRSKYDMKQVILGIQSFETQEKRLIEMLTNLTAIFEEKSSLKNFRPINFKLGPLGKWNFDVRQSLGVNGDWSLREVMIKMYQFPHDEAQSDHEIFRLFKPTAFLIFQSEDYKNNKQEVESLLGRINETDEINDEDKHEATLQMTYQLYQMERLIGYLIHSFEFAVKRLKILPAELCTFVCNLTELKVNRKGRVLVVVFWGVAFLRGEIESAVNHEESGDYEIENFLKQINVNDAMTTVYRVILQLVPVLNASTLSNSDRLKKKALLASFRVLQECENILESIRTQEVPKGRLNC